MASDVSFYRSLASEQLLEGTPPSSGAEGGERDGETASDDELELLIKRLRTIKVPSDMARRKKLRAAAQDFVERISDPQERVNQIVYSALSLTFCRVANDMNIFEILAHQKEPLSVHDISRATRVEPALLARVLRYLASIRAITEVPPHGYKPNALTKSLCSPNVKPALWFASQAHLPPLIALPEQLAAAKYRTPTRSDQIGGQAELRLAVAAPYDECREHPMFAECFKAWTTAPFRRDDSFLDAIDIESFFDPNGDMPPSFVDIGGSSGNTCRLVCEYHPSFSSHLFLQDLDSSVIEAEAGPGVTKLRNDFWSDQPTDEPRVYYFENVLCRISNTFGAVFLKTVADAMSDDSIILLDELVLPDEEAQRRLTEFDLMLLLLYRDRCGTGKLRTTHEWQQLIQSVGLNMVSARHYDKEHCKAVIVVSKRNHLRDVGLNDEGRVIFPAHMWPL